MAPVTRISAKSSINFGKWPILIRIDFQINPELRKITKNEKFCDKNYRAISFFLNQDNAGNFLNAGIKKLFFIKHYIDCCQDLS